MSQSSSLKKNYKDVFRNRDYMLLWGGQTVSQIGDALTIVAIPLLIFEITQSATSLTLAFVLEAIPWILIGPIAGVWVDKVNRKLLLIIADFFRMGLVFCLFWIDAVWQIYLIGFLSQVMASIFLPARSAAIAELVDKTLYVKAIGLSHVSYRIVQVIGPSIAALLLGFIGTRPIFIVDTITFLIAGLMTLRIRRPLNPVRPAGNSSGFSFWPAFKEGFSYLVNSRLLRYVTSINILKASVSSLILIGSVLYVKSTMDLPKKEGDSLYGMIVATSALGMILGTWAIGYWEKKLNRHLLILSGLLLQGAFYLLILLNPGPSLLMLIFFLAGLASSGALAPVSACYAEGTPSEIRGRVYSVTNSILQITSMVTYSLAGIFSELWGVLSLFLTTSILLIGLPPLLNLLMRGSESIRSIQKAEAEKLIS